MPKTPKTENALTEQVLVLKALASEPRLEIVRLLREHPQCVGALTMRLGMTQPAVSQHLRLLRQAGLVRAVKSGTWMHYALAPETVERCGRVLAEVFGGWVALAEAADGRQGCPPELLQDCQPAAADRTGAKRKR